jgi:Arc/MetJ-type ribon-helix-helix transcriptional regulator
MAMEVQRKKRIRHKAVQVRFTEPMLDVIDELTEELGEVSRASLLRYLVREKQLEREKVRAYVT